MDEPGHEQALRASFLRIAADGTSNPEERWVAVETPIAIEVNGMGYAVLMATPADLVDLATGFLLSERLIDRAADLIDVDIFEREDGVIVRTLVSEAFAERVAHRVRHRATDASCGLCGIENLEQALRPLPRLQAPARFEDAAIFRALDTLEREQPLNRRTRAVHAAAFCEADGTIRLVREDVGRHNAFDKLIGAVAREGLGWERAFALLSSRCSYELVEKAVVAGCPMLVTVSAPTSLALARAAAAELALKVVARSDAFLSVLTP